MNKSLWLLLATQVISGLGETMSLTGLVLFVSQETGSSMAVAAVYGLQAVAIFLFAPFTGAIADRREARALCTWFNWFLTVWTAGYLVVFWLVPKAVGLPVIAVMVALATWPQFLVNPSYARIFQHLTSVPGVNRSRAVSVQSLGVQSARILGALIGAYVAGAFGPAVFLVDSATYALANLILLFGIGVRVHPVPRSQGQGGLKAVFEDIWEGLQYAWRQPGYLGLFLVWMAGFILWGVKDALAPEMLAAVGRPRSDLGLYSSVSTVAEFVMAAIITSLGFTLSETVMILAAFGFGLVALATGFFAGPVAIFPLKFLEGCFGNLLGQTAYKVLVLDQDPGLTGRLGNFSASLGKLTIAVASFGVGFYADKAGEPNAYVLTGLLVIAVTALGLAARRGLSNTR